VCPSVDGFISLKASPPQILSPPVFLRHSQSHTHTQLVYVSQEYTTYTDVVIGRGSFIAHVVLMRATSIVVIGSFHSILRNLLFVLIKSKRTRSYIVTYLNISHCWTSTMVKLSSRYSYYFSISYFHIIASVITSLREIVGRKSQVLVASECNILNH